MKNALAAALLFALPALAQDYRFDEVRRNVELNDAKIAKGQQAKGGDSVETGWFSYALIAAQGQRAKFEIFGGTQVKLATGDTPGVLLSLERGRIRAAFDKITGSEPRVVKTPGALLAVRGTQFDVIVDRQGNTTVDVWEGTVEVRWPARPPMFVHGGEQSVYGRFKAPITRPMPEQRRRDDPNRPRDDRGHGDGDHNRRPDAGGRTGGDSRRGHPGGSPNNPPPPPPPQKPPL